MSSVDEVCCTGETSPHTRGKRFLKIFISKPFRNIPAYAGKAVSFYRQVGSYQKHPRIRGESVDLPFERVDDSETSPHTRGKRACGYSTRCSDGNIPAYAGKAVVILKLQRTCKKHPRIRGESRDSLRAGADAEETSPHTRGKLRPPVEPLRRSRNIPAYAGKASLRPARRQRSTKHPRIRGESLLLRRWRTVSTETSPHTRGKQRHAPCGCHEERNIPAYAGKAGTRASSPRRSQKHPRIRGES